MTAFSLGLRPWFQTGVGNLQGLEVEPPMIFKIDNKGAVNLHSFAVNDRTKNIEYR